MNNRTSKTKSRKECPSARKSDNDSKPISYRLKCAKTANGLSHYVMYGDVDKKQALL